MITLSPLAISRHLLRLVFIAAMAITLVGLLLLNAGNGSTRPPCTTVPTFSQRLPIRTCVDLP